MAGWHVHGPEKDGDKRMERQSKGSTGLEAYCKGGQGPPRAVAPPKKKKIVIYYNTFLKIARGAHPASYKMGTRSFPGVKWPGRGVNEHPPPDLAPRLKKEYSYISTPPMDLHGLF